MECKLRQSVEKYIQNNLNLFGVKCSMSRKGNCWNNNPIESFFASLKKEHVFFNRFKRKNKVSLNGLKCFIIDREFILHLDI